MTPAAIQASGLGKRYRDVWALRDCDLEVPAGRVVALVGQNGAGKTTLLQLLVGLIAPTVGTVSLFCEPVVSDDAASLAQIGFVAQEHPLYEGFRVRDLLHLGRSLNLGWDQELAERRLAEIGISLGSRAGHLSGGQRAQVSLTMALAKRPRLLVLDEPVAGLDPVARREVMRGLMDAVACGDLTVVLSSHVVSELERLCDYLVLLRDGRVELAGELDEVLASHALLTGPRMPDGAENALPGIISAVHAGRQSQLLVRDTYAVHWHPRWERLPVTLEEVVLAYLDRRPRSNSAPFEQVGS